MERVWTLDSLLQSRSRLRAEYVGLTLLLAAALFSLVEILLK
ncbi:MAG TPA: hypothetical protein VG675_07620 [Bryobacteraceae bacterium]|nr:hypothetical protein [Bryobacteraceae bacterium]